MNGWSFSFSLLLDSNEKLQYKKPSIIDSTCVRVHEASSYLHYVSGSGRNKKRKVTRIRL